MDEELHFALLRISMAQILKAAGFDRCKMSVLNVLTDIYVHFFKLLTSQTLELAKHRTLSDKVQIQDITQAMLNIGFLKPSSFESYLDPHDIPKYQYYPDKSSNMHKNYNTKSVESFYDWLRYSDIFRASKKVSKVPKSMVRNLIEKRQVDDSSESSQDKKKRKLKAKQEYYNHFKYNSAETPREDMGEHNFDGEDQITWLDYLIEKDLKLGHDLKFLNTSLGPELISLLTNSKLHPATLARRQQLQHHLRNMHKNDHIVLSLEAGGENTTTPSPALVSMLPYNLHYDKAILDDLVETLDSGSTSNRIAQEQEPESQDTDRGPSEPEISGPTAGPERTHDPPE